MRHFLITLLVITANFNLFSEIAFEPINYNKDKDFSHGIVDLFNHFKNNGQQIIKDDFELKVARAKKFKQSVVSEFTEDDFKLRYDFFINKIRKSMAKHGAIQISGLFYFLNAFAKDNVAEFDCDSTLLMVHIILHDLQVKFAHYDIMSRFYFDTFLGHACGVIKASESTFLYEDLNSPLDYYFRPYDKYVKKYKSFFWHTQTSSPKKGIAFKAVIYHNIGVNLNMMGKYDASLVALLKAREYCPNNILVECNLALTYYSNKEFKKANKHFEAANQICVLRSSIYDTWLDCMAKTDDYTCLDNVKQVVQIHRPEVYLYYKTQGQSLFKNMIKAHVANNKNDAQLLFIQMINTYKTCLAVYNDPNHTRLSEYNHQLEELGVSDSLQVTTAYQRYIKAVSAAQHQYRKACIAESLITENKARKLLDAYLSMELINAQELSDTLSYCDALSHNWCDVDLTLLMHLDSSIVACFADYSVKSDLIDRFLKHQTSIDSQKAETYIIEKFYARNDMERQTNMAFLRLTRTLRALIEEKQKK